MKQQKKAVDEKKDKITKQLNRIQGQIKGTKKMYVNDQPCIDVVRQIIAARNSLGTVARELLSRQACSCIDDHNLEDLNQVLKEILKI